MGETEEKNEHGTGVFLTSLVIGLVIGLAVGFLYAPRRGEDTRRRLSRRAKIAEAKAVKVVQKSTEAARQAIRKRQEPKPA